MNDPGNEYLYIWEYRVRPGQIGAFEELYGPRGEWVRLFQMSPDYIGTLLIRDGDDATRYLTIDRWRSRQAWRDWRVRVDTEFQELDRRGEQMTLDERFLGNFEIRPSEGGLPLGL